MTITYMLDTNTVSYILKGKSKAARMRLAKLRPNEVACVSSITVAEIRFGLAKRAVSEEFRAAIDGFLAKIRVLPFDRNEAAVYGELRAKLESTGRVLENMDLLIAAHAVAVGARLVTHDAAFKQVRGLGRIFDWAADL